MTTDDALRATSADATSADAGPRSGTGTALAPSARDRWAARLRRPVAGGPLELRLLVVLLTVALLVRVVYCLTLLRGYTPMSDASDYYKIAVNVASGHGFSTTFPFGYEHPTAFRPPLFPALLGAVFAVTGPSLGVAEAVNVVLGCAVVGLAALVAASFGGRRAGLLAGGLAAVYPPLLADDGPPLTESLALTLLLAGLLALGKRRVLVAGVAVGLLVLTRPSAQLLVPVVGLWLLVVVGWRRTAVFAVAVAVVVLPWVARNEAVFGKPVLVTSNGFNVAAVWSPISLAQGKFADPVYDPRFAFLRVGPAATNEADMDAAFRSYGLHGLRTHLNRVPGVVWNNTRYLLDLHVSRENGAERYDGRNLTLRYYAVPVTWLVMALGLIGLVRLARRRGGFLLLLCVGYFFAVSIVTVSPPRLRVPLDVLFVVGAASLVGAVLDRRAKRRDLTSGR